MDKRLGKRNNRLGSIWLTYVVLDEYTPESFYSRTGVNLNDDTDHPILFLRSGWFGNNSANQRLFVGSHHAAERAEFDFVGAL